MEQQAKIFGVEASATPDNAFYVPGCKHAQHRAPYAACLSRINDRKSGRLETRPECSAAIGRKDCPALDMRHQELIKGEAIFFISRTAMQEAMRAAAEERGQLMAQAAESGRNWAPSTKRPKKKTSAAPTLTTAPTDYSAAINAAMAKIKSAATPPAPPAVAPETVEIGTTAEPAPKVGVKLSVSTDLSKQPEGMSMMDFIRMSRNRAQQATATA